MELWNPLVVCLLFSFCGVSFAVVCNLCISDDYQNGDCWDLSGSIATQECNGECFTTYVLHDPYFNTDLTISRGCVPFCTEERSNIFGYEYETKCCSTDQCNTDDRPTGYSKCYECDLTLDPTCLKWDYIPRTSHETLCEGQCSKLEASYNLLGIESETTVRSCETPCVELQNVDYLGLGEFSQYCCSGDYCNGAATLSALTGILLGALALVLFA